MEHVFPPVIPTTQLTYKQIHAKNAFIPAKPAT